MPEPGVNASANPGGATGRTTSSPPGPDYVGPAEKVERPGIIDALGDLVQLFVDYARQETGDLVQDKVVQPAQKVGQLIAFAFAAAFALILGMSFISVGLLILFATWVGWPAALLIIGGVLAVGAAVLTMLKMRRIQ